MAQIVVKHRRPSGSSDTKPALSPTLLSSCGKGILRRFYWDFVWEKYRIGNVFHRNQRLFLSENVDVVKMVARTADYDSHVEEIDETGRSWLENHHHHFLTLSIWHVLHVNVNRTILFLTSTETCSNHEFLLGATENLPGCEKLHAKSVAWS